MSENDPTGANAPATPEPALEPPPAPEPPPPANEIPKAPHPANIGIAQAHVMERAGYSRDAAVAWLFENYPQHFPTPTDARNAYEAG